jgi:hypothetical protein
MKIKKEKKVELTAYELHLKAKEMTRHFEGYNYHEAMYILGHLRQEVEKCFTVLSSPTY